MDYEKEYNKLKAGIKNAYLYAQTGSTKAVLENILPGLKESDDERVRKALIRFHKSTIDLEGIKGKDIIAWLEKQVSVDEDEIVEGIRRGVAISLMNHIDANSKGMCLSNMECEDIENAIINEDWDKVYGYMKKKLEKQGEPIDKIEPKFHEGEWIVNDYCMGRVIEITNDSYLLDTGQGIPFSCKSTRLWDITKDANDGDVLASKDGDNILIFRNLDTNTSFSSYYNIARKGELGWSNSCFIPATKSQCDILMKAMTDAGYTFDFEKKELKKLTQQEVTKISDQVKDSAWSEEDEHKAKNTIYFLDTAKKHYASTVELDACIDWLKSLKDKVQPQPQPKQGWSEEDEKMLDDAIGAVGAADYYTYDDKQEIENWLKSLKQRIGENSYDVAT